ncbi:hypothetical protein [Streptomyces sp. NPDC053720]|uniref:hypothetical protein n=1 Tax=Streptomyces sp. NPDC053720 TaxID=3154855 RepID=UPI0034240D9A
MLRRTAVLASACALLTGFNVAGTASAAAPDRESRAATFAVQVHKEGLTDAEAAALLRLRERAVVGRPAPDGQLLGLPDPVEHHRLLDQQSDHGTVAQFKDNTATVRWVDGGAFAQDDTADWSWVLFVNNCR